MIVEKDTIKCEVVYDDSKQHRLMWKQMWDAKKPLACVIMINPCQASTVITDTTTYLVVNNISNFGDYGGVTIVTMRYIFTYLLRSRYSWGVMPVCCLKLLQK